MCEQLASCQVSLTNQEPKVQPLTYKPDALISDATKPLPMRLWQTNSWPTYQLPN